jgi:hypothetical protein
VDRLAHPKSLRLTIIVTDITYEGVGMKTENFELVMPFESDRISNADAQKLLDTIAQLQQTYPSQEIWEAIPQAYKNIKAGISIERTIKLLVAHLKQN